MTPEEIEGIKKLKQIADDSPGCPEFVIETDDLVFLCDSALRLSAIENARDEEVEKLVNAADYCTGTKCYCESCRINFREVASIAKSRNATIADLRAKLGEATERIQDLEDGIEAARLGL